MGRQGSGGFIYGSTSCKTSGLQDRRIWLTVRIRCGMATQGTPVLQEMAEAIAGERYHAGSAKATPAYYLLLRVTSLLVSAYRHHI